MGFYWGRNFTPTATSLTSAGEKPAVNCHGLRDDSRTVETHLSWGWYCSPFLPNLRPHAFVTSFLSALHFFQLDDEELN